ncbi:MAG: amino acid racemase [Firmicutes bacterium]|nr:amino acid racemase [Bacillota bacterium]
MKKLGVIGGVGPGTTAEFYLKIVFDCQECNKEHRPNIIISSVPSPYQVERDIILENKNGFTPLLVAEAKRLQKAGADFIVMPCNTLHCDIKHIRRGVKVPVISIVEETINYIKKNKFKKVGLMATMATVKRKVYSEIMKEQGIDFVLPSRKEQTQLNEIIIRLISGQYLDSDRDIIYSVIDSLKKQGADCIALACTDLQLLKPVRQDIPVFDTMSILADAAIEGVLK